MKFLRLLLELLEPHLKTNHLRVSTGCFHQPGEFLAAGVEDLQRVRKMVLYREAYPQDPAAHDSRLVLGSALARTLILPQIQRQKNHFPCGRSARWHRCSSTRARE